MRRCCGLYIPNSASETTLVATRCEFANSDYGARVFGSLTSAKFNNCLFHSNGMSGLSVQESTVHLHGEATAIHSNVQFGIHAAYSSKILLHLPSHHNTFYNNGKHDRLIYNNGTTYYQYQRRRLEKKKKKHSK